MKKLNVAPLSFGKIMRRDGKAQSSNIVGTPNNAIIEWGIEDGKEISSLTLNGYLAAKFYGTFCEMFAKDYAEIYYEISPNWIAVEK